MKEPTVESLHQEIDQHVPLFSGIIRILQTLTRYQRSVILQHALFILQYLFDNL